MTEVLLEEKVAVHIEGRGYNKWKVTEKGGVRESIREPEFKIATDLMQAGLENLNDIWPKFLKKRHSLTTITRKLWKNTMSEEMMIKTQKI